MKKLINAPENYVTEMLEGLVACHPSLTICGDSQRVVRRSAENTPGKVGIVSGGGSGHLPLFTGYVGQGFIDACAIGNVFEGPAIDSCVDAIHAADNGQGVLLLFGNYGGDRMNFEMASELAAMDDVVTATVLGNDDVASASPEEASKRRGVAGLIYAYKIAGAKAEQLATLEEVARVAQKAVDATRSIGIALAPCRLPSSTEPNFQIHDNEMEMGMGIHGEPGLWRSELKSADETVAEMLNLILADLPLAAGDRVSVLLNGLGATPLEELFILFRCANQLLADRGVEVVAPIVGNMATSMEMAGASLSILKLDDELEALLTAPGVCPFWRIG